MSARLFSTSRFTVAKSPAITARRNASRSVISDEGKCSACERLEVPASSGKPLEGKAAAAPARSINDLRFTIVAFLSVTDGAGQCAFSQWSANCSGRAFSPRNLIPLLADNNAPNCAVGAGMWLSCEATNCELYPSPSPSAQRKACTIKQNHGRVRCLNFSNVCEIYDRGAVDPHKLQSVKTGL